MSNIENEDNRVIAINMYVNYRRYILIGTTGIDLGRSHKTQGSLIS